MSRMEEFETLLKDVVSAKRLSASKMNKITEIALKNVEKHDQLVSILFRTHKALPTTGISKVSSLYVFDALARAARHQMNKSSSSSDSSASGCATLLSRMEGVVESIYRDMIAPGTPESKEKPQKILDIWTKGNTFPSVTLAKLSSILKETGKEYLAPPSTSTTPPTDPRQTTAVGVPGAAPQASLIPSASTPVVQPISPPQAAAPATDVHATLLALLSQAANLATTKDLSSSTATNGAPAAQLALLQQLTQAAQNGGGVPVIPSIQAPMMGQGVPGDFSPPPGVYPGGPPSYPPGPYPNDSYDSGRRDSKYTRYDGPDRGRAREDYYPDDNYRRESHRGGYNSRGGPAGGDFRGHDRRGQSYNSNSLDRPRDDNGYSRRRSRSRSPGRDRFDSTRRDVRPYSPPRRPSVAAADARKQVPEPRYESPPSTTGSKAPEPGKDEFGRELRPASPTGSKSDDGGPSKSQGTPVTQHLPSNSPPPPHTRQGSLPLNVVNTPAVSIAGSVTSGPQGGNALEMALATTIDFSSPAAWSMLKVAWETTNGYTPSMEELMQLVMAKSMGMGQVPTTPAYAQPPNDQWKVGKTQQIPTWEGDGGGRGGHRGGGQYRHGPIDDPGSWGVGHHQQESDAIVLGGSTDVAGEEPMDLEDEDGDTSSKTEVQEHSQSPVGRMQKVGDAWVFQKGPPEAI